MTAMPRTRPRHWVRWLLVAIAGLVVLAAAGPFIYIHFFDGSTPAALSLSPASTPASTSGSTASGTPASIATASSAAAGSVGGTWTAGSGSIVGYRVNEVLLGQTATAFSVPMATVHSDKSQRDAQFDGRIMDVSQYPAGTFTLTSPIDLAPLPAAGVIKEYTAHGDLTLHGTT